MGSRIAMVDGREWAVVAGAPGRGPLAWRLPDTTADPPELEFYRARPFRYFDRVAAAVLKSLSRTSFATQRYLNTSSGTPEARLSRLRLRIMRNDISAVASEAPDRGQLVGACMEGKWKRALKLLATGADVNEKSPTIRATPLMFAARSGRLELVQRRLVAQWT